ncbi:MAG: hypothetical protein IPM47_09320 [Sphingobacteriales bacterium]|nr:MAG: hypothetical protein IPM47_09320 [Sphingobacteriales bacterium]
MNRKEFLKAMGIAGITLSLPASKMFSGRFRPYISDSCVLIPSETAGPFPLDLTTNIFYFRQDIREDRAGVQFNVRLKIIGNVNCEPMPDVRVNIWHCDKDGNYSGYGTQTGLTYLRGYQMTDTNGEVEFITILPGWYNGRVCHIHFQVYVSSAYAAVSQFAFDQATINTIYAANPTVYTKGEDPLTPATDSIFADGYSLQVATITPNPVTGGYDAYLEVTVQGTGTTGVGHIEKETAKQVTLGQNFPNPFSNKTVIPFELHRPAQVKLELWNLNGTKVATIDKGYLPAGNHSVDIQLKDLNLPVASYAYQIAIQNEAGTFVTYKLMTGLF